MNKGGNGFPVPLHSSPKAPAVPFLNSGFALAPRPRLPHPVSLEVQLSGSAHRVQAPGPRLRVAEVGEGRGLASSKGRWLWGPGPFCLLPPPSLGLGLGVPVLSSCLPPDPEALPLTSPGSQGWEGLSAVNTPLMAPGPTRVPHCPALEPLSANILTPVVGLRPPPPAPISHQCP